MNKKLIIFDLDGTLINTVKDLNAGINYALKKNGFEEKSVEHTSKAIGNGISKTIWRSLPDGVSEEVHDQCLQDFREYYSKNYSVYSEPYPGMKGALVVLKNSGYLLAVATNKLDRVARKMIDYYFPNIFDAVQGENGFLPCKPDPSIINFILGRLNVSREEAIYVGDSEVDIETAKTAHIPLILANYGFHRSEDFCKIKDVPHIDTPHDLLDLLLK